MRRGQNVTFDMALFLCDRIRRFAMAHQQQQQVKHCPRDKVLVLESRCWSNPMRLGLLVGRDAHTP